MRDDGFDHFMCQIKIKLLQIVKIVSLFYAKGQQKAKTKKCQCHLLLASAN